MLMTESMLTAGDGDPVTVVGGVGASRGVNALHKRAQQLKRWQENEDMLNKMEVDESQIIHRQEKKKQKHSGKIKFSDSTLFLAACASNDYDECKRLLDNSLVDINVTNIDGLTALHQACIEDNIDMVQFLIGRGAEVNCCDNEGWTPLHATASCGHAHIARMLLDGDADTTIVNNDGELACDIADNTEVEEMIRACLDKLNVDSDALRKQEETKMVQDVEEWTRDGVYGDIPHPRTGATVLHVAAAKGYINVLSALFTNKLLRSTFDVNIKDNEGWTPLCAACYWQQPSSVELLLQNNADVYVRTNQGQSLEDLTEHELILELIEKRRAKLKEEEAKQKAVLQESSQNKIVPSTPPSTPAVSESETQRKAHAKRARETRRSTQGISAEDVNKAKDQLKLQNHNSNDNNDSQALRSRTTSRSLSDGFEEKDYKKLYEDLLVECEKHKRESNQKEQEWNREKRHFIRKISELEEETMLLDQLKNDNQRLKDENGALIRVISKLSK